VSTTPEHDLSMIDVIAESVARSTRARGSSATVLTSRTARTIVAVSTARLSASHARAVRASSTATRARPAPPRVVIERRQRGAICRYTLDIFRSPRSRAERSISTMPIDVDSKMLRSGAPRRERALRVEALTAILCLAISR